MLRMIKGSEELPDYSKPEDFVCSKQDTGILILGHGSRRQEANEEWEQIWKLFQKAHPDLFVQRGYIEFVNPTLAGGVELLLEEHPLKNIVIVPLFLTTGRHLYQHIPEMIAKIEAKHPNINFVLSDHIGPDRLLLDIIEKRVNASGITD